MGRYNVTTISEEQELEIIDLFLNTKMSLVDIAKQYNRKSKDFIYRILKKHNIDTNRRHVANKLLEREIQEIIEMYQTKNISCAKIAEQYNVTESTIARVLKNHNIARRKHYAHTFNEYYFDKIDTPNKAYLLGFLYADGCIQKNNVVSIIVHQKDIEILQMFKKELNASNEISEVKSKPHVRIFFCSKHMCDTLINIGCRHNKTYSLSFPNIDDVYKYDFIRGFMDGDGSISLISRRDKKYISLSFTGTLEMMQELKRIFNMDSKIRFYRGAYSIHIGKTEDVLRILNNIYNNAELYMTRKFKKYQEYCEYKEKKRDITCQQQSLLCS